MENLNTNKNELVQLAYISTATNAFDVSQTEELLGIARDANRQHKVTGFLLYNDGCFFQVIEGSRSSIDQLYENILADRRHKNLIKLLYENISERTFSSWSMAFYQFELSNQSEREGFSEFLTQVYNKPSTSHALESLSAVKDDKAIHMLQEVKKLYLGHY